MAESKVQAAIIKKIKQRYPECIVMKNDAGYLQGIPDLLILYKDKWASLEIKASEYATHRPNQDYYVNRMDEMSFSRFIYPENQTEVLDDLNRYFMEVK